MDAFKVKLTECVPGYCRFNYYLLKGSSESDTLMEKVEQLRGFIIDYLTDPNKIETTAKVRVYFVCTYHTCMGIFSLPCILNLMYMYVIHDSMIYSIAGNVVGKINCSL